MKLTPRQILVVGWIVFLLYAYPGYMTAAGADQLVDSRTGSFTDWHPVMLSEVWRIVGRVIAGPSGMLFLQSWLLLGGAYFLLRRLLTDRAAALAALVVLLFPSVIATTAVIAPESQLASFMLAGAAALASDRRGIRLTGLGLLVVACGMNAAASIAALPIVLASFRWSAGARGWRRVVGAAVAWCLVVVVAYGLTRWLVDDRSEQREIACAMNDIVGTLRYAELPPDDITTSLAGVRLATSDPIELQKRARVLYPKLGIYSGDGRVFEAPTVQAERDALESARWRFVQAAPRAYLRHRWGVWRAELGFGSLPSKFNSDLLPRNTDPIQLEHAAFHSLTQRTLIRPVKWLSRTFLFRPRFYLFLAVALLIAAAVRRRRESVVLLASAIGYEVALMFVITQPQFPDSHWLIVSTILATILFSIRELEARNERVLEKTDLGIAHDDDV